MPGPSSVDTDGEESLLLIALLRTLERLSYQDMYDWFVAWSTLALACSLPLGRDGQSCIPSPSQQGKRGQAISAALLGGIVHLDGADRHAPMAERGT